MLLLINNVHEKKFKKVKTNEILKACQRYLKFALVLHVFSQAEARNFLHLHY